MNGKISCVHELEELILLKCPDYPMLSIDSIQSLSRFQWHFLTEIEKNDPKICMEPQRTPNSQNNPKKEEQNWRHHTS